MEWITTTAKTVDEAQDRAIEQLGIPRDEAEFDVIEEPKSGLFGLLRGEAKVRARVRPTMVRPKNDRRRSKAQGSSNKASSDDQTGSDDSASNSGDSGKSETRSAKTKNESRKKSTKPAGRRGSNRSESHASSDDGDAKVSPQEVGQAAVDFMEGLVSAFGLAGTTKLQQDGTELDVTVDGEELGLLVGHGGNTLSSIQDLTRVSAQRRLGDHETRLRVDVGGYREKRRQALEAFAHKVADRVVDTGESKALEPMSSSDRKVVHDTVTKIDGVESRSDGSDPNRRVVISPT